MSSILKALRKLEEEKASRREGSMVVARDILRGHRKTAPVRPWLLVLTLAVLIAAAGAFLLIGQPPETVAPTPADDRQVVPAAVEPPAGAGTGAEKMAVAAPAGPLRPEPAAWPAEAGRKAPPPVAEKSAPVPNKSTPAGNSGTADMVVSGIAFQQDRDSRLAVVNDLPVMVGTIIAGARVEEIREDRVVFSRDGDLFEVVLAPEEEAPSQ